MPNYVRNRITLSGDNVKDKIQKYLKLNTRTNRYEFDFNTVIRMPDDLLVERSSASSDGLKLYITKVNPYIPYYGEPKDKFTPDDYNNKIKKIYFDDTYEEFKILSKSNVDDMKKRYGKNIDKILKMGRTIFNNYLKYGYSDWYVWALDFWGCKWNACDTNISEDFTQISFDTPWTPSIPVIEELARLEPELDIKYEFSEEQPAYMCGYLLYEGGDCYDEWNYPEDSKEAFELYFKLWGRRDDYVYNRFSGTYEYADQLS